MKHFIGIVTMLFVVSIFPGCKKDSKDEPKETPVTMGTLKIHLKHYWDQDALIMSPHTYYTAAQDTIRITKLSYYLSNVMLQSTAGEWVSLGNYNLVDLDDPSTTDITIENMPVDNGSYKKIRFSIGVDSARNHTGAQTGALDPGYGMFWSWNTGYIFFRIKGGFNTTQNYSLDIGGDQNLPVVEIDLPVDPNPVTVPNKTLDLQLKMDLKAFFNSPNAYDLKVDAKDIHNPLEPGITKLVQNIGTMSTLIKAE